MSKDKTTAKFMLPAMRGKTLHRYMAQKVAQRFISLGFEVSAERPICITGGGKNYVDLLVSRDNRVLAIEIETTARNVLSNAAKANELGLRLWIVTPNKKVSLAVTGRLKQSAPLGSDQIRVLTLGELLNLGPGQINNKGLE